MNKKIKKILAVGLSLIMIISVSSLAFAEETTQTSQDTITDAEAPPTLPDGEMPQMPEGGMGGGRGEMQPGGMGQGGDKMPGNKFTDVDEDAWYAEYVNFVSMRGIMNGKDGSFRPTEITTRGEYVLALYNAAGAPEVTESCSFTDVAADSEYADAIAWAETNGIASGAGDGLFLPDDSLTREMAMTFLYRALEALGLVADTPAESVIAKFSDNSSVSSWATDAMNTLVNMGVICGTDEGKLNPGGSLINAETATMIYRAVGGKEQINEQPGGMGQGGDRMPGNGERREMTEEEMAQMQEQLLAEIAAKLEAGEITEEEYEEIVVAIENGTYMPEGRDGRGMNGETPPQIPAEEATIE